MLDGWTQQEKDFLAITAVIVALIAGGALSLTALEGWLVEVGVLIAGSAVPFPLPWSPAVGLDLPRLAIAVAIVLSLVAALVFVIIAIRRRDARARS